MNQFNPPGHLAAAWELLIDLPLPQGLAEYRKNGYAWPQMTLLAMPVIGLITALLLELFGAACGAVFGHTGASLLFALAVTIFLELKDSGRGTGLTVLMVSALANKVKPFAVLPQLRAPHLNTLSGALPVLSLVVIELFKLGTLFMLFHNGAMIYLTTVLVLVFTAEGFLMTLPDLDSGKPFLAVPDKELMPVWFVAIFIVLFVALRFPAAVLLGIGAAFLFALVLRNCCDKLYGGATAEIVTLAGSITELLLLFIGLLLAIR